VSGEKGKVNGRALTVKLHGLVDLASCPKGFFREQMRGFHDLKLRATSPSWI
jgi:hypothetical protein